MHPKQARSQLLSRVLREHDLIHAPIKCDTNGSANKDAKLRNANSVNRGGRLPIAEISRGGFRSANGAGSLCGRNVARRQWELGRSDNADTPAATVEQHDAIDQGVQSEVAPLSYTAAWMEFVADLANQDIASIYGLPAELFHTTTLGVRVATVAAGALSFFMCHGKNLSGEWRIRAVWVELFAAPAPMGQDPLRGGH
jgi:hypothetical protein